MSGGAWTMLLAPTLTALGVVVAAAIGHHTSKRGAASADWAAYTTHVLARLSTAESRLDTAEQRAAASDLRAERAEQLNRIAIAYLRQLTVWFAERVPDQKLPAPPPELGLDL